VEAEPALQAATLATAVASTAACRTGIDTTVTQLEAVARGAPATSQDRHGYLVGVALTLCGE
jgi:hypothetical protein